MAEEQNETPSPGRKLPLKTILILAAVLVIEAAAISSAFLFARGPSRVEASGAAMDDLAHLEEPVEKLVVADKFQNIKTGKSYLYDTEIYVVVKRKHEGNIDKIINEMSAQIAADMSIIFRRAQPAHLLEPTLATLQRQIKAVLDKRIGRDEDNNRIVLEVLITKCTQFRAG